MTHWFARHAETLSLGDRAADAFAAFMGGWAFVIGQTVVFALWVLVNSIEVLFRPFDPYPFILFNLVMSAQAAYATPLILMSQNRQAERDRHHAEEDYRINREAEQRIEALQEHLHRIEDAKLDKLLQHFGIDFDDPRQHAARPPTA